MIFLKISILGFKNANLDTKIIAEIHEAKSWSHNPAEVFDEYTSSNK